MNTAKTALLLTLLTLLLLWVGRMLGGPNGMTVAFIFALVMNFGAYWFSDRIVLMMYRAEEVNPQQSPRLHAILSHLTQEAHMPMPKVYSVPSATPNAFATGRNPHHAVVAITQGILEVLNDDELEGVLAHELAHIRNRDILISSIVATIAGAIFMVANMTRWAALFGGIERRNRQRGDGVVSLVIMSIIAPLLALLIQLAVSRSNEYRADQSGSIISKKPRSLANALRKLQLASRRIPMNANPTTTHMFIVNPLSGGGVIKLFSTHPPVEERVRKLEELAVRIGNV